MKKPKLAYLAAALLVLAVIAEGCHSTTKAIRRNPRIEPFNFRINFSHDQFQIEGFFAHTVLPGPRPTLLVLDSAVRNAGQCITSKYHFTQLGINLVCISLPGSGKSSGPGRFIGPQTVEAARRALDLLATRPDVDALRMGVWGLANGAVAAGLLMDVDRRPRVVILQSGTYDMIHFWPEAHLLTKLSILHQVWPSRRVLGERSVIQHLPTKLTCKVLILHGGKDRRAPLSQAERLAADLRERGTSVDFQDFANSGDRLGALVDVPIADFLRQNLLAG